MSWETVEMVTERNVSRFRSDRLAAAMIGLGLLAGCAHPRDQFGHTWYVDGVGNLGFGTASVPSGLDQAGYKGHAENFRWSITLNPILDQTIRVFARLGGLRLTGQIENQLKRHPETEVNLIGLSAGSGVVMWAVENLKPPYKVKNVILLGSSLSSDYDARKALKNITGEIIVYYSPKDGVLDGAARLLGSIDGKFGDCAGLVGMRGPGSETGRIKNVAWSKSFSKLGWTGSHTDCTSEPFVRVELAKHVVPENDRTPVRGRVRPVGPKPADEVAVRTVGLQTKS